MRFGGIDTDYLGLKGLLLSGQAQAVLPSSDSGWKSYADGRLFLPAATNYLTNPSFVTDTNADGLADGIGASIANATVTKSIVTRTVDGKSVKAQSIRVVGLAGVGVTIGADFDITAVGSFAQNDYGYASAWLKITELAGCTLRMQIVNRNAGSSALATTSSSAITAVDSDFVRRSVTAQLTHADTSRANVKIVTVANFEEGDAFTVEIAMAQFEKASVLTPFFDGSYPDCAWTGAANASTSTRTASSLIDTDYVTIDSTGVTAAGANVAYSRNSSGTYYGPVIVTPAAKSADWQTRVTSAWPDPPRLFRDFCVAGDLLLPLNGDSVGYLMT